MAKKIGRRKFLETGAKIGLTSAFGGSFVSPLFKSYLSTIPITCAIKHLSGIHHNSVHQNHPTVHTLTRVDCREVHTIQTLFLKTPSFPVQTS